MNDKELVAKYGVSRVELALQILEDCDIIQEFEDTYFIKIDKESFNDALEIVEEIEEWANIIVMIGMMLTNAQ